MFAISALPSSHILRNRARPGRLRAAPTRCDQPDNAARVVAIGAGIRTKKSTPPARLRKLIVQALADESLREAARRAATAPARGDGAEAVTASIERLAGSRHLEAL